MILLTIPSLAYSRAEEVIEEEYSLNRDGKVILENISGSITVKGWGKNKVRMIARKTAGDEDDLDKVSIDVKA